MPSRNNSPGFPGADILSFSPLRWRWEPQRPQHLLTRAARDRRVIVVEEPAFEPGVARMEVDHPHANLILLRPCLPYAMAEEDTTKTQRSLLDAALRDLGVRLGMLWYFTPMALLFSRHLRAPVVVYDCMAEAPDGVPAPDAVRLLEGQLLRRANLVFTDGERQHKSKCALHPNVHPASIPPGEDSFSPRGSLGAEARGASDQQVFSSAALLVGSSHDRTTPTEAAWDATWAYMRELMAHAAGRIGRLADLRPRAAAPFADGVSGVTAHRLLVDHGK